MNSAPFLDPMPEFWAAAAKGDLLLQRSLRTGEIQFYPRPFAAGEGGDVEWIKASRRGVILAKTISHIASPFAPDVVPPIAVVLVELEEGPRVLGRADNMQLAIGDPVRFFWCFENSVWVPAFALNVDADV